LQNGGSNTEELPAAPVIRRCCAAAAAAGTDKHDALRQRLREHAPLPAEDRRQQVEQRLGLLRQALRKEEIKALKRFEDCDRDGEHRASTTVRMSIPVLLPLLPPAACRP
jgi:hypothetical protein